ncbi:MAG: hypothetical protein JSV66_13525 [Trueperaceae bacterium]|nr:MAG: hypothetical protein JSV66_13525 [Trueperaceae bacterium]
MPRNNDKSRRASHKEAVRGIYLDFEGFKDSPPALLGISVDEAFEQVVLDPALALAAEAKGLRVSTLPKEMKRLMKESKKTGRFIFAYSRHEAKVVGEHTKFGEKFEAVYKDGRKIAKRWFKKEHSKDALPDWSLQSFMRFIGSSRPRYLGYGNATSRLQDVRDMLEQRGSYEALTPVAKGKWTRLLNYNRYDCTGLKALMVHATAGTQAPTARSKPSRRHNELGSISGVHHHAK